jgi:hypothetical protein
MPALPSRPDAGMACYLALVSAPELTEQVGSPIANPFRPPWAQAIPPYAKIAPGSSRIAFKSPRNRAP